MGRGFKKPTGGAKRSVQPEKKEENVVKKKAKKEEEPEPEPVEEVKEVEEVSDEEVDDEEEEEEVEDEDDEDEEEVEDEELQFDFEAFPPVEEDQDGIVNILTQTFLRTDIDLKGAAKTVIEQAPHGVVITQGQGGEGEEKEGEEESEEDGMIYGLCTTVGLNSTSKDDAPKFVKDIFTYLLSRAKKGAPSEVYKRLEEIHSAGDGKTAMFINDRLLNFPPIIVPQIFSNLRNELNEEDWKKYQTFIYIQKIRIAETDEAGSSSGGKKSGEPPKKKGKMGKAEKKRAAAAALAGADVKFDNVEDKFLFKVTAGKETHFDYPVHMDVEPGSKFHVTEKDGKKWNPFRRVVIMDAKRLTSFLEKGAEAIVDADE